MKVKDASEIRRVDAARPAGVKSTQLASPSVVPDKVSTDSSAQVAAAGAATRAVASQDQSIRLEAIAQAVKNGTFQPDPERIAQRILDDAEITAMLQTMLSRG
ncbi:MAG TPA: flagellar biosynthesis anti-sigma factor FlgM [Anaeromyxobacter sp.]|nr:flagellar biosynthesis anti-sigma factor FlgM [Anaeromyxobacter sp.]